MTGIDLAQVRIFDPLIIVVIVIAAALISLIAVSRVFSKQRSNKRS